MSTDLVDLLLVSTLAAGNLGLTVAVVTLSSLLRRERQRSRSDERSRIRILPGPWRDPGETVQFDARTMR